MSYRSTGSTGAAFADDGAYDGAPAEFDPMGGNAGLATPYNRNYATLSLQLRWSKER
jgi:hypothetical protein